VKAFQARPLEHVTKLWIKQVKENEEQFDQSARSLQQYELNLIRALGDIEKIEN